MRQSQRRPLALTKCPWPDFDSAFGKAGFGQTLGHMPCDRVGFFRRSGVQSKAALTVRPPRRADVRDNWTAEIAGDPRRCVPVTHGPELPRQGKSVEYWMSRLRD